MIVACNLFAMYLSLIFSFYDVFFFHTPVNLSETQIHQTVGPSGLASGNRRLVRQTRSNAGTMHIYLV